MSSRREMLEFLSLSRLPSTFQEVEYIESSGTQYIDTQWIPTSNSKVNVVFAYKQVLSFSDQSIFGSRDDGTQKKYNLYIYQNLNTLSIGYGTVYNESNLPITLNQKYDVDFTTNGTNGTLSGDLSKSCISASVPTFDYSLYLFARNRVGSPQNISFSASAIYKCMIYDNGALVRNFVPCYRKADNVAGLYDLVNNVFYTNAGTGTFAKGADV